MVYQPAVRYEPVETVDLVAALFECAETLEVGEVFSSARRLLVHDEVGATQEGDFQRADGLDLARRPSGVSRIDQGCEEIGEVLVHVVMPSRERKRVTRTGISSRV